MSNNLACGELLLANNSNNVLLATQLQISTGDLRNVYRSNPCKIWYVIHMSDSEALFDR